MPIEALSLVERAREFAVAEHQRINHRRKYTKLPYDAHLANVANLVATVSDDQAMIAAAWLHDVVEDTPATLYDVELGFGRDVASLVESLTDISRLGDGNRAARKRIDRLHLMGASPRAQTIKLADLIDNAQDIFKHDQRFARVFLQEMGELLKVLRGGDSRLMRQAHDLHAAYSQDMGVSAALPEPSSHEPTFQSSGNRISPHLLRFFAQGFTAADIAEPVHSVDQGSSAVELAALMDEIGIDLVCLRYRGEIQGYLRRNDLHNAEDGYRRPFRIDQLLKGERPLLQVIRALSLHDVIFITVFGSVAGCIRRTDINKPVVRMWLFGILTLLEAEFGRLIDECYPDDSWRNLLSAGRLGKAVDFQVERQRCKQPCALSACLQFTDKLQIMSNHPRGLHLLGVDSRRSALQVAKDLGSLRNNLAHAQNIATHDWGSITRIAEGMRNLTEVEP
jgi:nucleotide-binding universal stress UspA family protein